MLTMLTMLVALVWRGRAEGGNQPRLTASSRPADMLAERRVSRLLSFRIRRPLKSSVTGGDSGQEEAPRRGRLARTERNSRHLLTSASSAEDAAHRRDDRATSSPTRAAPASAATVPPCVLWGSREAGEGAAVLQNPARSVWSREAAADAEPF